MTRYPGEVYYLPPDAAPDGDPKHRPHLLLSTCNEHSLAASLAYCSTQATDAAYGAAHVLVDPAATHYRKSGLSQATYVYPSRLVVAEVGDLGTLAGRIIDEMTDIRRALSHALGIGTGSCIGDGPAAVSLRGSVLRLRPAIVDVVGTTYVIVVTDPEYSLQLRFLNVIPVYDGEEFDSVETDLVVEGADWLQEIGLTRAVLATSLVQSVFLPQQADNVIICAIDDDGMAEVDEALREHFGLP